LLNIAHSFDSQLFVFLNSLFHHRLWEMFLVMLASKWLWLFGHVLLGVVLMVGGYQRMSPLQRSVKTLFMRGGICPLAILLSLTLVLSHVLSSYVLKETIQRERPCYGNNDSNNDSNKEFSPSRMSQEQRTKRIFQPLGCHSRYGMPSNHGVHFAALAAGVWWFFGSSMLAFWLALVAVIVGFSRVFLGLHYPADVVVGWGFGIGVVWLIKVLSLRIAYFSKGRAVWVVAK